MWKILKIGGITIAAIAAGSALMRLGDRPVRLLSASGDSVEAAARLFDLLHRADAAPHPRIAVAPIPGDGLAAAIRDRLTRAAAPRR